MKLFGSSRRERELDEEIAAHLAIEIQQQIDRGASPEEARASALRQFGNVALVKEVTRESWRSRAFDRVRHDIRHVIRHTWSTFRREPGIQLVTILTLALVMGANATMFSAINTLLLRNRPGAGHPGELVDFVHERPEGVEDPAFSYPNYLDYRNSNTSFSELAAYTWAEPTGMRLGSASTEIIQLAGVSGNYFDLLQLKAAAGRLFTYQDDRPGALPAAVISHRLWQQRFERRTTVIGSTIVLRGRTFTIIGVTPEAFVGTEVMHDSAWIPLTMYGDEWLRRTRSADWLGVVGRLKPASSLKQARAEMTLQTSNLERYPENKGHHLRLENYWYQGYEQEAAMKGLTGMSLLVLLVACANIASIGLSRALARQSEIATRLAIGAPRRRVAFQLLWETIALFIPAAVAGIGIAKWLVMENICSECDLPQVDISPDWRVAILVLCLMLVAAVISTIAPAVQAMRADLASSLKSKSGGSSRRNLRLQGVLIVAQVAASIALLVIGSVYGRTLLEISSTRVFDPRNVSIASIHFDIGGLSETESNSFIAEAVTRSSVLPGILAVSASRDVPQNDQGTTLPPVRIWKTAQDAGSDRTRLISAQNGVSPGYFKTLKIPIIQGRDFNARDSTSKRIAIVSESISKRLWPAEDPVGKTIYVCPAIEKCNLEIVGVAAEAVRGTGLPVLYRPFEQTNASSAYLVFRGLNPAQTIPEVRKALSEINHNLPIVSILPMKDMLHSTFFFHYLIVWATGILGSIAAALASLGIYGVASHAVATRIREIGIRTALGARPSTVIRTLIRRSMILTAAGLPIGCAGAIVIARSVPAINLYFANYSAPGPYIAACAGLLLVSFVASYLPIRRAARSNPMNILRHE